MLKSPAVVNFPVARLCRAPWSFVGPAGLQGAPDGAPDGLDGEMAHQMACVAFKAPAAASIGGQLRFCSARSLSSM